MRELAIAGLVALCFGLGAYYATGELGRFTLVNLTAGGLALLAAAVAGARRLRGLGAPAARRVLLPRVIGVALAALAALALERAAAWTGVRLDLTTERRFELSEATRRALEALPFEVTATLYYDEGDPRIRSTRVLLRTIALTTDTVRVRERVMDDSMLDTEHYDLASSNSIVIESDGRFEIVERPTEASFLEGLLRMQQRDQGVVYVARGSGEGDFRRADDRGYAGLASALSTQGYRLRDLVLASVTAIPDDAAAVLIAGARRGLRAESLAALSAYLEGGGSLVALLEPGAAAGIEPLLAEWGFEVGDGVVVDPASGPVAGMPAGVNPIVEAFADHPVTRGLGPTRMAFFLTARPVRAARKPEPSDRLRDLVYTSARAWVSEEVAAVLQGRLPEPPAGRYAGREVLAAAGRYPRAGGEARILVFGDSDFASNQYLRALYNMDLLLNAVHWVVHREVEITHLPKVWTPDQAPLTPSQTLAMFYGVGLLVPELLLIASGVVWLRRRSA